MESNIIISHLLCLFDDLVAGHATVAKCIFLHNKDRFIEKMEIGRFDDDHATGYPFNHFNHTPTRFAMILPAWVVEYTGRGQWSRNRIYLDACIKVCLYSFRNLYDDDGHIVFCVGFLSSLIDD